jgi:acyl-CoA thioester hydrolase
VAKALPIYRTQVLPEWVDYNGHLRDAYYVVIASLATDALMDHIGIDATYRQKTHCTLYTLEAHIHYFHEVKEQDLIEVTVRIIAADEKRIHAAFELNCARLPEAAASVEFMLLHVEQAQSVAARAFAPQIASALERLKATTAGAATAKRGSRKIELRGP